MSGKKIIKGLEEAIEGKVTIVYSRSDPFIEQHVKELMFVLRLVVAPNNMTKELEDVVRAKLVAVDHYASDAAEQERDRVTVEDACRVLEDYDMLEESGILEKRAAEREDHPLIKKR